MEIRPPDAIRQQCHEAELVRVDTQLPHFIEKEKCIRVLIGFGVGGDEGGEGGYVGGRHLVEDLAGVREAAEGEVHGDDRIEEASFFAIELRLGDEAVHGLAEAEVTLSSREAEEVGELGRRVGGAGGPGG